MSAKILTFPVVIPVNYWTEQREILAREIEASRPEVAASLRGMNKC